MTRHEIGSYIGLTLETVSRTLSALHEIGWISVDQKTIEIRDLNALRLLRRLPTARVRKEKKTADTAVAVHARHTRAGQYATV